MSGAIATKTEHCPTHGDFESRNYFGGIWSTCPACEAIKNEQRRADDERKEAEARQQRWLRRVGEAGIPERFCNRTLASYHANTDGQRKALAFATRYAGSLAEVFATGRSALFIGKPGTGKTHLAVGIGMQAMEEGRTVLFCTVLSALRRIKATWAKGAAESESEAIDLLAGVDLLILDEVGVQFGSDFEKTLMFEVLNERYNRRNPTILISNLDVAGVRAHLGDRVYDRLREDGGQAVVFDWHSYRAEAGQQMRLAAGG